MRSNLTPGRFITSLDSSVRTEYISYNLRASQIRNISPKRHWARMTSNPNWNACKYRQSSLSWSYVPIVGLLVTAVTEILPSPSELQRMSNLVLTFLPSCLSLSLSLVVERWAEPVWRSGPGRCHITGPGQAGTAQSEISALTVNINTASRQTELRWDVRCERWSIMNFDIKIWCRKR